MSNWKGMTKKQRSEEMKRRLAVASYNKANKAKLVMTTKPEDSHVVYDAEPVHDPAMERKLNERYWEGYAEAKRFYESRIDDLFDYIGRLRN